MKKLYAGRRWLLPALALLVLAAALGTGLSGCGKATTKEAKYYCPMHPTYVSDRPGDCPICNMRLVKVEKDGPKPGQEAASGAEHRTHLQPTPDGKAAYVCPMHPQVTSDKPGECPECGMKLEPTKAPDSSSGESSPRSSGPAGERSVLFYRNPMDPSITSPVPMKDDMGMDYVPVFADDVERGGGIEGLAPVSIDTQARRLAGIQTAPARLEQLSQGTRAVGTVVADERLVRVVHTKISGWVDKLHMNVTGQPVHRGQPILSIYSPELLASQEEFLRALEATKQLAGSTTDAQQAAANLLQAARRRLELFDVPESFIAALERSGEPQRGVTLAAPNSGYVTSKGVFEGQRIEPGMELFTVTDLSRVWIEADVYEYEAQRVRDGQEATLSLPYDPDTRLTGHVAYIYPYVNPETRTLKVRFEFPNRDLLLKPAMFVDVSLRAQDEAGVVIPESAVLDSGLRKVVFVEASPGRFEPREVRTGVRADGKVRILSGVREGEFVVVRANFLLDSESRLRSAIAASAERAGDDR